jgi:hypothetical protein
MSTQPTPYIDPVDVLRDYWRDRKRDSRAGYVYGNRRPSRQVATPAPAVPQVNPVRPPVFLDRPARQWHADGSFTNIEPTK